MKQLAVCAILVQVVFAQGYDTPLTLQGLDHTTFHSAASRGMGGLMLGVRNDVSTMFSNPASLRTLDGIQVSVGGVQEFSTTDQVQQYAPLKYYSNFSLLMEGLTGLIPNPSGGGAPSDTVWRPYDNIGSPNWSRSEKKGRPIQIFVGTPSSLKDSWITFGFGRAEYARLNHYYLNNNVLSPAILSVRPSPFPIPTNVSPAEARWYQYSRSREGSLWGTGVALAFSITNEVSLGISAVAIQGSTDDYEQHTGRGKFTFYANYFRLDSVYSHRIRTGTSEYDAGEFTLSGTYSGRYVTAGFSVKPPMTISRVYSGQVIVDTGGTPTRTEEIVKDGIRLPWRGTVGLSIAIREELRLGFEYEILPYASATYSGVVDSSFQPWLSASVVHVGLEYMPVPALALRAGMHGQSEVFEPDGNPIPGEPVTYSIYSAGCGLKLGPARLNVAYEYGKMKYQDIWGGAVSLNNTRRHTIVADLVVNVLN